MATRRPNEPPISPEPRRTTEIPRVLKPDDKNPLTTPPGNKAPPPQRARRDSTSPPAGRAGSTGGGSISADARRTMIAQHAYLRAERRGFAPGNEEQDWLAAEVEVDALLRAGHGGTSQ